MPHMHKFDYFTIMPIFIFYATSGALGVCFTHASLLALVSDVF